MKTTTILFSLIFSIPAFAQQPPIHFWRPYDQRGVNMFETSKQDSVDFENLRVRLGGNFTQQFQALDHSNTADVKLNTDGKNVNELYNMGPGFNLATANLNIDVQLEDGIRMNLVTYLSSRHHPEAWVKGGFIQIDRAKFLKSAAIDKAMEYLTLKVGHMEINYGDAHFRRTDNGNAFYNPFVGNYIMDAFTTEIGSELYFQHKGFLAMGGITGGEINGNISDPSKRKPTFLGKIGYDRMFDCGLRTRLTGSVYHTGASVSNTLYGGDRTGSRYYLVLENTMASTASNFTSGRMNPGFRDKVTAFVINPFVKYKGFEIFGNFERASGRAATETEDRTWNQIGVDGVYRIGKREWAYVAGRYNRANGKLAGSGADVSIDRIQAGVGAFITKNINMKVEYVTQKYNDFPSNDIKNGGKFNGVMIESSIAF